MAGTSLNEMEMEHGPSFADLPIIWGWFSMEHGKQSRVYSSIFMKYGFDY